VNKCNNIFKDSRIGCGVDAMTKVEDMSGMIGVVIEYMFGTLECRL
jgi:hypothetical protein